MVSFSILLTFHTFMGNIFLLNYLIAILSTTYETLLQSGIFMYKVNLYQYCERYLIAFNDKAYGEIIVHPPPIAYLSTLMLPFIFCRRAMVHITLFFSYMMYWFENILLIFAFFWFEFFMAPLAYARIWFNLCFGTRGKLQLLVNCLQWFVVGIPVMMFLHLRDVYYLIRILCKHQGSKEVDLEYEEEISQETRERIYNSARSTVIALYKRLHRHLN